MTTPGIYTVISVEDGKLLVTKYRYEWVWNAAHYAENEAWGISDGVGIVFTPGAGYSCGPQEAFGWGDWAESYEGSS